MSAPLFITVNSEILVWARQESGYSLEQAAQRLNVKSENLIIWEQGKREPTPKQMEKLARLYRRPLSLFFQAQVPQIPPLASEYRRLPHVEPGKESPEFRLAVRQMQLRRENALNLMAELGIIVPIFALQAHADENPVAVGQRLRMAAKIDIASQFSWNHGRQAWNVWRAALEDLGILVIVFSRIHLREARGLALLPQPLPVAAVNSKEVPASRAYTLLHEAVHLMLAAGREEKPALEETRSAEEWSKIERFAEIAASHALIPEAALTGEITKMIPQGNWDLAGVQKLARRFSVTPFAMATRLRESQIMSWRGYMDWRAAWDAYVKTLAKRGGGRSTPAEKSLLRAGRPFTRLVLEVMNANRITSSDAAHFLDLKFDHFPALRELLHAPGI